jgi:L-amino acid N-acyltransferase YncA
MAAPVRLVGLDDGASCARIYAPYVEQTVISFEEHAPSAREMSQRIERTLERFPWFVYETEGDVIGYAYGSPHSERAAYRWSADVSIYVDQRRHRAGVGRALYTALLDTLRLQGVFGVFAGISLPNSTSVGFHESFGFQHVGTFRNVGFKHGRWVDVGWWQLDLRPLMINPPEPKPLSDAQALPSWRSETSTRMPCRDSDDAGSR